MAEAPNQAIARRRTYLFAGGVTLLFLAAGGYGAFHHEMWRDETQAWLLARDSLTPWALVWNCRYEGHPVLWHLGPWVLSRFTSLPDVMQAYHLLIATATAFLVARFAPFTWVERALLAIGYLFLYEYGVVCRDYGIGVLLIMTYCVLYPRRFQQLPAVSVVLFLLSQTSVHALLVAMAAGGSLFLEVLLRRRKPEGSARWPLALACLLLVMAGYAVSIWQLVPPPDSGFAVSWTTAWEPALARRVAALPAHAMWIWPRETLHFWGSSRVVAAPWFGRHLLLYSAVLPVAAVLFLMRRPAVLLTYIAGTLALLAFFYVKYFGSIRHHGFLYVLLVAAAWMALAEPAVPAPHWRRVGRLLASGVFRPLLVTAFVVQALGTWAALRADARYTFSGGRETGRFLRRAGLVDVPVIAWRSPETSTVVAYAGLPRVWYEDGDRYGSYIIWDNRWRRSVSPDDVIERVRSWRGEGIGRVLLLTSEVLSPRMQRALDTRELFHSDSATVTGEQYYVYDVPAGPPLAQRRATDAG